MEWDQIADKWAAMAYRLRRDTTARPKNISGSQETRLKATDSDGATSGKISPKGLGDVFDPTSHQ